MTEREFDILAEVRASGEGMPEPRLTVGVAYSIVRQEIATGEGMPESQKSQ